MSIIKLNSGKFIVVDTIPLSEQLKEEINRVSICLLLLLVLLFIIMTSATFTDQFDLLPFKNIIV